MPWIKRRTTFLWEGGLGNFLGHEIFFLPLGNGVVKNIEAETDTT